MFIRVRFVSWDTGICLQAQDQDFLKKHGITTFGRTELFINVSFFIGIVFWAPPGLSSIGVVPVGKRDCIASQFQFVPVQEHKLNNFVALQLHPTGRAFCSEEKRARRQMYSMLTLHICTCENGP